MNTSVTMNGRTIDLARALPLTLGDWKVLKARGVTTQALQRLGQDVDPEILAGYVFYVLHKADPAVTELEVDALTFGQITPIMKLIGDLSTEESDRPFSGPSTPSPAPTAGVSERSTS